MRKKKDATGTQVLLGHKHAWTDTAGHAHRVVFDERALENPKTTWVVLLVVTFIALAAGAVGVFTAPHSSNNAVPLPVADSGPSFAYASTVKHESSTPCTGLAAGWNDEFFVADSQGVTLYDAEGNKLGSWQNDSDEAPTAIAFVSDQNAATNGLLLVAYGDKVKALRFSLDNVVPSEGEAVIFTAQDGALGELEHILTVPDADIRGLASSSERLFVADYLSDRVRRYSWKKIDALKNAEQKEAFPDCVIGDPDTAAAHPGLKPVIKENFSIAYLPVENELFVSNSGHYRVDAFNAGTGSARAEHSLTRLIDQGEASGDSANPIAIAVASNKWVIVAETSKKPGSEAMSGPSTIRFFGLSGEPLGTLPRSEAERNEDTFVIGVAASPDSKRVYALNSNGDVDIWSSAQ